ncbi:MAG TPA: cupin domain-containing protein [Pseudomonas sp.]|nr:cupin domain-containing protein [Pseudomonas sp.]
MALTCNGWGTILTSPTRRGDLAARRVRQEPYNHPTFKKPITRTPMNIQKSAFFLTLALAFQSEAFALEKSAAVKVEPVLKTTTSWDGKPIEYPAGQAEITGLVIEIAPGGETGWHSHPVPSFGMILEGELEVQLKSGAVNRLKAGEALAEVVNTLHNGRNVGSVPVKLVVFYSGAVGQKLTVVEAVH